MEVAIVWHGRGTGEMKMGYEIREATLSDYEKLQPIHKEVHDLHVKGRPDKYRPADNTLDFEYYKGLVESNSGRVYFIDFEGNVIAFAFLRKCLSPERDTIVRNEYIFIEDFGVSKTFKGQGLGRLLFSKAVDFAKETGAKSLELGVWEFNEEAIKFYEAMGMKTQSRKMEIVLG